MDAIVQETTDSQAYEIDDYLAEQEFAWSTRNDGWWAAFLVFSIIFGPKTKAFAILPPIRFVDFVIVFMVIVRGLKAYNLYGGFLFSYRSRLFSLFMIALGLIVLFSMSVNMATGRIPYHIKNFFYPIQFFRMALIAAIMGSCYFGDRQVKQFVAGICIIGLMCGTLAFIQKARPWAVAGFLEKYYAAKWEYLEMRARGVTSRVVGTFGNPNRFSLGLVVVAAGALAGTIYQKGPLKLLSLASYLFLGAVLLIATGSRTGLVGLFIVTAFILILSLTGRARVWVMLLIIFMVLAYIFVRANIERIPLNPRMKVILGGGGTIQTIPESLFARYVMWKEALAEVSESWIIGIGATKAQKQLSDNGYIQMLLRTGIIGLLVYVLMYVALLRRGLKAFFAETAPHRKAIITAVTGVLVGQMVFEITGDFFWNPQNQALFAAFVGVLCGISGQTLYEGGAQRIDYQEPAEQY